MRVLQLIDSLEAGGAERIAVNYANALVGRIEASFLCSTREEGILVETLSDAVGYYFLNKKSSLDIKAIYKLNSFIEKNRISILHAHASSFFIASIMKLLNPKLYLIWHDHFGNSEFLDRRPIWVLKWCSLFFNHILCVNTTLETWAKRHLFSKLVNYMPNYAVIKVTKGDTKLAGTNNKRIVCLANLRPQKGHLELLKAFGLVIKEHSDWTIHLVGKDFSDSYSKEIKDYIRDYELSSHVFLYGSCRDTLHILKQSTVGVLASKSEGLPLSLLEYGFAGLPVVATKVGDCAKVISNPNEGILVESENHLVLSKALIKLIENATLRKRLSENLHQKVISSFSESSSIKTLIKIYKKHQK